MFEWKDDYSVNVTQIDKQHKELFRLGKNIYELVILDDEYDHYDEIMIALDKLMDYTIYHFDTEEKLMREYGFDKDEYEKHQIEHAAFVGKIKSMYKKDIDNNQKKVLLELLDFILKWIKAHILITDKGYSEFFNNKGLC